MTLTAEEVLAAAVGGVWVPDSAREIRTDEYRLIAYPAHFADPTVVTSIDSSRPASVLVDEVMAAVDGLGRDGVNFFGLSGATRPQDLEQELQDRGATRTETLAVLALDLRAVRPDLVVAERVELEVVLDLDTMREADRVEVAVFGGSEGDEEQLAASLAPVLAGTAQPRVLARRDGVPVGSAGHAVTGDVLRLWGACVLPEARRTGVYQALLDHRLRAGLAAGCRMALVKGRVETSARPLLMAGFTQYGEERAYYLARG
jgi:GNAT superfamily N-acetyltransferase